jgi:hypothetical protein
MADLRRKFFANREKTRRLAPAKQGFLTKRDEALTEKAILEPVQTGS